MLSHRRPPPVESLTRSSRNRYSFLASPSSNLAQHIVTLDTQRIHSSRAQGIAELCSGLRIEAPAMPPAYHPAILDRAMGKRRPTMRTFIVQCRKVPADPCHADRLAQLAAFLSHAFGR